MTQCIRFQRPVLPPPEAIERYLAAAREDRWFSNFGPCAELLQVRLTELTGRPCVVVANATLGLMSAIAALRDRNDTLAAEALVPSFAFAASAQAAVWNGLRPVFVDVGEDHWHLDPDHLETALAKRGRRVAVVVALSSFGVPPPPAVRERWAAVCADAGVPLLVDSAAGFGARAGDGVAVGAQGDVEVVSFHATKPLATGEGGAVFCRTEASAAELQRLVNFALGEDKQAYRADGLNAKMAESAAAIALAALDGLPNVLETRRQRAHELLELLPPAFERQLECERGTWQFVPVAAPDSAVRDAILDEARRRHIELRTYYDPLHLMPAFADCVRADDLEVTESLGGRMLSLPMANDLTRVEVERIAEMVVAAREAVQRVI
jgi:dTDP-4-amino-4,6-dideoxygalactose transaminase